MNNQINIVLVLRSGGDFHQKDVYLLVSHINKYWEGTVKPHVTCLTDTVEEETKLVGLTFFPLETAWDGWWSKLNLFEPGIRNLRPFLYLDLDTVVVGDLSTIVPPDENKNLFITLEDFYRKGVDASGMMWVTKDARMDRIYKLWKKSPEVFMQKFRGDQDFIASVQKADVHWQAITEKRVQSFKPNRKWQRSFPLKASVICFHGSPRIVEAAKQVEWVNKYVSYEI